MFLQELQHWICLASIFLTSEEFGMIYFFHQISRLSIYIKISALFGWDRRIFYSWKVVILGVNLCQMNLVMFWWFSIATPIFGKSGFTLIVICSGARVLQHPTYIWQVFSHIDCSIILWWFLLTSCAFISNLLMLTLVKIIQLLCVFMVHYHAING